MENVNENAVVNPETSTAMGGASMAVSNSAMKARETVQRPTITGMSNKSGIRFVTIGIGQGGCKIASVLSSLLPYNPFQIAINTSNQDLDQVNIPDNQKFKIGGVNANGAGKNRKRAIQYFKMFSAQNEMDQAQTLDALQTFVMLYEEVLFHPTKQTIILVSFTSDGGSGSGLGPIFTTHLTNYVNSIKEFVVNDHKYEIDDFTNTVPRPVVIAVVPKCNLSAEEGKSQSLQNNIECFNDIQKAIDHGVGHYFIADNNLDPSITYKSTKEMYDIINSRIAAPFLKFLGIEMNSDIKCMDLQDKVNALRITGASSFVSLTEKNIFQFVTPHGQSITRIVPMLKYVEDPIAQGEEEASAKALIKKLDVTSIDETSVFFQIDKSKLEGMDTMTKELLEVSMIGFFGFKDLSSIIEDLNVNLHRVLAANDKKESVVRESSTGFNDIKENGAELENRFGSKTLSQDDINNLF